VAIASNPDFQLAPKEYMTAKGNINEEILRRPKNNPTLDVGTNLGEVLTITVESRNIRSRLFKMFLGDGGFLCLSFFGDWGFWFMRLCVGMDLS